MKITARNLKKGHKLSPSGFIVTNDAWVSATCKKEQVIVEGFYPGNPTYSHFWNGSTIVNVLSWDV